MNKLFSILVVLLAISNIVYSFWKNPPYERFFGFEINTWIYRLFWLLLTILIVYNFLKEKAIKKEE